MARMREAGVRGSVVTVIGDTAEPYLTTHLDPSWVRARGLDPAPYEAAVERFARTGEWQAGPWHAGESPPSSPLTVWEVTDGFAGCCRPGDPRS
ncbi:MULTISPECIES: hypothetical protein [unclassified Streptomyces]|uniref:hypothetical protein n=1 Tax=unclassified Streptomyces TaxID=2593676 RepID=UPI002E3540E7|nr:hypothetical protein [Streptomyces sp. NBC_01693]